MDNMPGFTAEASLYKTEKHYLVEATDAASSTQVVPQIPLGLCTKAAYYCARGWGDENWVKQASAADPIFVPLSFLLQMPLSSLLG